MQPNGPSVNLPPFTRGQARTAARRGAQTREEVEHMMRTGTVKSKDLVQAIDGPGRTTFRPVSRTTTERDGGDGDTVTIATAEYDLLSSIVRLTRVFFPMLEGSGAGVQRPTEWNMLREKLKLLGHVGATASAAETDAVLGLLNAQRLLRDDE